LKTFHDFFQNKSDKIENRAKVPGTDKQMFGTELRENKHFHHMTTTEDGVQLGCYGHILDGRKYSTRYVADDTGYRTLLETDDLVTVHPKSGGERYQKLREKIVWMIKKIILKFLRNASFIQDFSEAQLLSLNIGYFFPVGCQKKDDSKRQPLSQMPILKRLPRTILLEQCPVPTCTNTCTCTC
jgi:hypothetical protein